MISDSLTSGEAEVRPWKESDLVSLQAMRNDFALQHQLMTYARGSTLAQVRDWLIQRSESKDTMLWVVASCKTQAAMGYVQVAAIDATSGFGRLGVCIAPAFQRRGYGRVAIALVEKYVASTLGLRKITLEVIASNKSAISVYESLAYCEVGRLRKHFLHLSGTSWDDVLVMEKFLFS